MLHAFTSVGAEHFNVTRTLCLGKEANFRRDVLTESARHFLPTLLTSAEENERNLIARLVSRRAGFIHFDDLNRRRFPGTGTSPGNY